MTLIVSPILFAVIFILILIVFINLIRKCKSGVEVEKLKVQNKLSVSNFKNDKNVIVSNVPSESEYSTRIYLPQPPGPRSIPVLGNLFSLRNSVSPFHAFSKMSHKYGDIFSLMMGGTRAVVVNNLELIKEILNENGKYFGGRPDFIVS